MGMQQNLAPNNGEYLQAMAEAYHPLYWLLSELSSTNSPAHRKLVSKGLSADSPTVVVQLNTFIKEWFGECGLSDSQVLHHLPENDIGGYWKNYVRSYIKPFFVKYTNVGC